MKPIRLVLSSGDYNGIGPEIIIKALADPDIRELCDFTIFGLPATFEEAFNGFSPFRNYKYSSGLDHVLQMLSTRQELEEITEIDICPGTTSPLSGRAAYQFLLASINSWKDGLCDCIVTAPVMKETFFSQEEKQGGQTEWIADKVGTPKSLMLMVKDNIRIAVATTHIAVKDISSTLTAEVIRKKGKMLYESLVRDFDIQEPKIALSALNPHAGENGRFGTEEKRIIVPALNSLKKLGGDWKGPISADALLLSGGIRKYDGILTMYHDQGLIPFKVYSNLSGVNFTAGLPLVRTSPDHGTAMDIAGKGLADESSMKEAIRLAVKITKRRALSGK